MYAYSPFIDAVAVEAWDAWFRWRERGHLRDFSIEATWRRVAGALSRETGAHGARRGDELFAALASWQLLLDERILAGAGTPSQSWPADGLVAVLNVPMFVRRGFSDEARFDAPAFEAVASSAVRALDDAALLAGGGDAPPTLRIGLIGLADALLMLGLPYAAEAGRRQACAVGRALAQGCLRGTVQLAMERGSRSGPLHEMLRRARLRGLAEPLIEAACRHGVRHAGLTALTSQPRLALLANNVADALEPLCGENHVRHVDSPGQHRAIRSSGYALTLLQRTPSARPVDVAVDTLETVPIRARRAMREAMRRWIDEAATIPCAESMAAD